MKIQFNPRLLFAEIGWRWSFGLGAVILFAAGWLRFFGSLPVSDSDVAALRSGNALMTSGALLHILQDVGPTLLRATLIIIPAVVLLWIAAATFGRLSTLELLLPAYPRNRPAFLGVLAANVLRAIWAVAMLLVCLFTLLAASFIALRFSPNHEQPNLPVYFSLIAIALPIELLLWAVMNWFFSLTPIFSVRDGKGWIAAARSAMTSVRQHRSNLFRTSNYYGLWRLAALIAAVALTATLAAVTSFVAGSRTVAAIVIILSLFYFALADWLYVARLAAYVGLFNTAAGEGAAETELVSSGPPAASSQPAADSGLS